MPIQTTEYRSSVEALDALIRSLVEYEKKYRISSSEFYSRYQRGEFGDEKDFIEWAGEYQDYMQLQIETGHCFFYILIREYQHYMQLQRRGWAKSRGVGVNNIEEYLTYILQLIQNLSKVHLESYEEQILSENRNNLLIRLKFSDKSLLEISEAIVFLDNQP